MTRRHRSPLFALSLLLVGTAIVTHGQAPGIFLPGIRDTDTPVFRTGAEAIAIDVFVTDENGIPVSGLTVDDFELTENGKQQEITTFRAVNIPLEVDERDRPLAEPDVASNEEPEGRVYLIIDGIGDPVNALKARAFLRRFLDKHFGPYDMAALVTGGLATNGQDFTSNRRLLQIAIDKMDGGGGPSGGRDLVDVLDVLARIPGRHKTVIALSEGPGFAWSELIDYQSGVGSLAFDYAHAAMGIATRNNITFYLVTPQGLEARIDILSDTPPTGFGVMGLETRMNLRALAEITGGFAHIASNDIDGALERIVKDASTYYMLGFNSDYRKTDGKFVRLDVRVKRPGLVVRTRSGYVSATRRELQQAARKAVKERPPIVEALSNPLTAAGHPIRVSAAAYRGDGDVATVVLTVETPLVMENRESRGDVRRGRIDVRMIATGASRRVFPELRIGDTISLPVNVSELTGNRVRLISEMSLPKGRHQIRVASGDRVAGNVLYDLEVPDFTDRPLMMSGLAIAASSSALPTVRAANESKKAKTKKCYEPSCAAQEVRNVPLTAWSPDTLPATYPLRDALPTAPTTARAFRRSDTVTVFAEIYDNKRVPRPVSVQLQLGQPDQKPVSEQVHNVTTRRASGGYGVTLAIPMSEVPPGRYVLRLVASASEGEQTATREIPVEVLP